MTRRDYKRPPAVVEHHPTGLAGTLAAAAVIVANWFGVSIEGEEAAIVIGAIVALVSWRTPR